ncbi:hypothetical protein Taro_017825 [Colocasia esculenta]|uniref:Uncharacterized protein n=1 Tax=Colocasia esculenta TaxID=4460 RepID=A0A843UH60_COLES|nr:hypothetical protein [Colocasia esculenta]
MAAHAEGPFIAPHSPQLPPSSSLNLDTGLPSFSQQHPAHASSSFGGSSVPPELISFLTDKFDTLNTSIQTMSANFELRIQRLENTVFAKFIEQKAASDYTAQRFNRLIGTMADASIELKEHQDKLEVVLQGILANSQADVLNTKQTLSEITKTKLSFAHIVDDMEGLRNLSAHIDEEISTLKQEFKVLNRPGWSSGSSSSSQPRSNDFRALQASLSENSEIMENLLHTRLSTLQNQMKSRTNIFCKGSVDTTTLSVDTMVQNKGRNVKKKSSQVDTSPDQVDTEPSQVDTRDLFQGTALPVWDSVSTHLLGRSTHSGIFVTYDSSWTRGTPGRCQINIGSCALVPQGYMTIAEEA